MRKVAIVGTAQTEHKERNLQVNVRELVYEVTKEVLETTGLSREDVDTMIEASDDYWDGRGCSNVYTFEASGAYLKEESKVEHACMHASSVPGALLIPKSGLR